MVHRERRKINISVLSPRKKRNKREEKIRQKRVHVMERSREKRKG